MKNITEKDALNLLMQEIDIKDLTKPENRWIKHSIYVGLAARRITEALGLNDNFALTIGYLHDIGRRIDHNNHPILGYKYLNSLGYENIARYSLTHSFYNSKITNTIGTGPKDKESYDFINNYLNNLTPDLFDNIVHLCDIFCLDTGFTTIEKRILDIISRKGISDNFLNYYNSIMDFKKWIELTIKKDFYSLFPEIKKEDLDNQHEDYLKLLDIYYQNMKNKKAKTLNK